MNRLILIGNGFDLAHCMKTSYNDFLLDYLKSAFLKAEKYDFRDHLIYVSKNPHSREVLNINYATSIANFKNCTGHILNTPIDEIDSNLINLRKQNITAPFVCIFNSNFIETLFKVSAEKKWVDIENEYYNYLIKIITTSSKDYIYEHINKLNEDFENIIRLIRIYLEQQVSDPNFNYYDGPISRILNTPIFLADFITLSSKDIADVKQRVSNHLGLFPMNIEKKGILPIQTFILNFNYTDTITKYLRNDLIEETLGDPVVINIHGETKSEIIFGFGDELDDNYEMIEKINNN